MVLRLEKAELKHKLDCKEQAIASFKQWQSRVADYKYNYWLNEGLKLANVQPDRKQVEALPIYSLRRHQKNRFDMLLSSLILGQR